MWWGAGWELLSAPGGEHGTEPPPCGGQRPLQVPWDSSVPSTGPLGHGCPQWEREVGVPRVGWGVCCYLREMQRWGQALLRDTAQQTRSWELAGGPVSPRGWSNWRHWAPQAPQCDDQLYARPSSGFLRKRQAEVKLNLGSSTPGNRMRWSKAPPPRSQNRFRSRQNAGHIPYPGLLPKGA